MAQFSTSQKVVGILKNTLANINDGGTPLVEATTASLNAVGQYISSYEPRMNAFLHSLVNRIIKSIYANRSYKNHFGRFKKRMDGLGDTIEEIYIDLCKVEGYDPTNLTTNVLGIHTPDVSAAFHSVNLTTEYVQSLNRMQVMKAFTSFEAFDAFIRALVEKIMTSKEYDEEQVFLYAFGRVALTGKIPTLTIDTPAPSTAASILTKVRELSNNFDHMLPDYTMAKNLQHTPKNAQYLFTSNAAGAIFDVNVLANAFNMDKAEWTGHNVNFVSFAKIDLPRLAKIFSEDPGYVPFTDTELGVLEKIRLVLADEEFFQMYEVFEALKTQDWDGVQMNWTLVAQYILSFSPFRNCVILTDASSAVSAISISGSSTLSAAGRYEYTATVTRTGFADSGVSWSVAASSSGGVASLDKISIDALGRLTLATGYATGKIDITATSLYDGTVTASKTVTLS